MARITNTFVDKLEPSTKVTFHRDETLVGFGVKVSPTGRISFIAEGRIRGGKTKRFTLGQYPALSVQEARDLARVKIQAMQRGEDPKAAKDAALRKAEALSKTLGSMFSDYVKAKDLKPRTSQDYRSTFRVVFADWGDRPVRSITRKECEDLFIETRDKKGLPTAAKAFRIISAVFNFAMADDIGGERLIRENPADVIKQKGYKRSVKSRDRYLTDTEISKLIHFWLIGKDWPETTPHGVNEQGINYVMLLLCSGLRRGEGLGLRWSDIDWERKHFAIHDTKNGTDHYVPLSKVITQILTRQKGELEKNCKDESPWVFPARYGGGHMTEPRTQLESICKSIGVKFRLHDLRRTFATHAQANGASFELIRKALNHKSSSVTEGYIITQTETLRPVFDAVADGYHTYYDPDWRTDNEATAAELPN